MDTAMISNYRTRRMFNWGIDVTLRNGSDGRVRARSWKNSATRLCATSESHAATCTAKRKNRCG